MADVRVVGVGPPRIVIAGTHSGVGKTTVATGLMAALAARGLTVQGFKAGPDYIDPQCHGWATGRPGRNLDTWLMDAHQIRSRFENGVAGADVAVIEGVMGLYDGAGGTDEAGSTADLARQLQAPVVLVVDAHASARSIAAVALGFRQFDPAVTVAGVIANRVGSDRHARMVAAALAGIGLPLLGALRHDADLRVPEDRLGLALPGGDGGLPDWIRQAATAMTAQVDLERLLALARSAGAVPDADTAAQPTPSASPDPFASEQSGRWAGLRVAVGRDAAFWFYYPDTFDLLRHWGVEPVFFRPLADGALPAGIDGLYLGGGFPERHAPALAANTALRTELHQAWHRGLPVLGECGGYLYLLQALTGEDGREYPMAGCIPGVARLQPRLQGLGYRTAEPGGVRGHVFHYTRVEDAAGPTAWRLARSDGEFEREDGFRQGAVLASYLHVHHATQPQVLDRFLAACRRYHDAKPKG